MTFLNIKNVKEIIKKCFWVNRQLKNVAFMRGLFLMGGMLLICGVLSACNTASNTTSGQYDAALTRFLDNPDSYLNKTVRLDRMLCSEVEGKILCMPTDNNLSKSVCSGNEPYDCRKGQRRVFLFSALKVTASNPADLANYKENCMRSGEGGSAVKFISSCTVDVIFKLESYTSAVLAANHPSAMTIVSIKASKINISRRK